MLHPSARDFKYFGASGSCAAIALCTAYVTSSAAQSSKESETAGGAGSSSASAIYGVTIPPGYRDWKVISVGRLKTDKINQLRVQLGNDIAIQAFKEGQ